MHKQIVFLVCGILFGALVGSLTTLHLNGVHPAEVEPDPRFSALPERDIDRDTIVDMSLAEAEAHRQSRYQSIKSIEDTLALPSDFAETEALYVLAGRADSDEIQNLLHQAARIREGTDRAAALGILFLRLTELDPPSAIATARSPAFSGDRIHESSVWLAWGRLDFSAALEAAKQGDAVQRNLAAQSLYASLRDLDDSRASLIESTLGISPSRDAQGKQLYRLASESPARAIQYIESLRSPTEQQERFRWLAYYLNRTERAMGVDYSNLIQSSENRRFFEQWVDSYRLQSDPEAVLEEALAEKDSLEAQNKVHTALQHLAQMDPLKALEYLDRIPDTRSRQSVKATAAMAMARSDPYRALAWAREVDTWEEQELLVRVISQIAQQDLELALTEAQSIGDPRMRDQVYSHAISHVAQSDPEAAARLLALIEDPDTRRSRLRNLATVWAQVDVDSSIDWILTLPVDDQHDALQGIGRNLVQVDVDAAIKLLPRLSAGDSRDLQLQIAHVIAQKRSVAEAQAFIAQFQGTENYGRLQVAVLSQQAASDPVLAIQMATSIEDVRARDQLVGSIVVQQAAQNPQQALQWLGSISDSHARGRAMAQIAAQWYRKDAAAAATWVESLPKGTERDTVIVSTVAMRQVSTAAALDLIQGVSSPEMRMQAALAYVRQLTRTDQAEAEQFIQTIDLTEAQREQIRYVIDRPDSVFN